MRILRMIFESIFDIRTAAIETGTLLIFWCFAGFWTLMALSEPIPDGPNGSHPIPALIFRFGSAFAIFIASVVTFGQVRDYLTLKNQMESSDCTELVGKVTKFI